MDVGGRMSRKRPNILTLSRVGKGPGDRSGSAAPRAARPVPLHASFFILAVLAVMFLAGCPNVVRPGKQVTGPRTPAAPATNTAPVSLEVTPAPPRAYSPSTFTVSSHPALGSGAVVTITLTMPAMAMPPTRISTHPDGKGDYQGTGAFAMPGQWRAEIAVTAATKRRVTNTTITVK